MYSVGLTGNFGMGKSTVLRLFGELGAFTYSADDFVHKLLEKERIVQRIAGVLGSDVLIKESKKNSLDKKKVADIIFNNPQQRQAVEGILHPEVLRAIKRTKTDIAGKKPSALIVFEVPLLFEAGYKNIFDLSVVVYCTQHVALTRLAKKGFSNEEVMKRTGSQLSITEKKKRADFVINNNNGIARTASQVKKIFNRLTHA